jgi:hypothetical protein
MIGKFTTWENSVRGNRKTAGKIPLWWEISLSGRKKVFRCMDHLVLRQPSYMRGFTFPFSLSVLEFIDWRYRQSCWYFRPSFVTCCPANLLFGSTLPPPSLCE